MEYGSLGFVKVAAAAPPVAVADPATNAQAILAAYAAAPKDAAIVLLPELAVTGYSCEDLFFQADLRHAAEAALAKVASATDDRVLVVGAPWRIDDGRFLNCAFVCRRGRVAGATPKLAPPNRDEFYEQRWFASGRGVDVAVEAAGSRFPLRDGLLCRLGETAFGIELCEDLWLPSPPSAALALGGAELLLNLSASTELIGKADYRRALVRSQSARTVSAYVYAGAGPTESTKDVVFGGHLIAAENGHVLAESERFALAGGCLAVEVDCQRLRHDRLRNSAFAASPRAPLPAAVDLGPPPPPLRRLTRRYARLPFVPTEPAALGARVQEAFAIQATGLARRMAAAGSERLVVGISGGLDSTLAHLVCLDALAARQLPAQRLCALTMPGPGTTERTLESARRLATATGAELREVAISAAVRQHLEAIGHDGAPDVTFENAQARERTQVLFDVANQIGGIVVGTGDLSELALGWCTFNADQTASYNVNAGVPKTLVSCMVRWHAEQRASAALRAVLERVLATPITPELLPAGGGASGQRTEDIVGPFELHDFFLFHFLRGGAGARKLFALACRAFEGAYSPAEVKHWLTLFLRRFFAQQFKRTTLPPGPKVGTVSLSPRGDWRMPDEASAAAFLEDLERLPAATAASEPV